MSGAGRFGDRRLTAASPTLGDGSKVGADGTQIDTWGYNLLAETSIRYRRS